MAGAVVSCIRLFVEFRKVSAEMPTTTRATPKNA